MTAIAGQSRFNLAFTGTRATPARPRCTCAATPPPRPPSSCSPPSAWPRAEPGLVATVGEFERPARRGQRDPGPRRRHARHPPPGRRRARGGDRGAARVTAEIGERREIGVAWSTISAPARDGVHARAGRARRRGGRGDGHAACGELPSGAGHDAVTMAGPHRRRDAVRALRGRHQPPSRRGGHRGRRGAGDRRGDEVRVFDLIVRGDEARHRGRRRPDRRCRAGAGAARARRSTRAGCSCCPAAWIRTCTSTSPGGRTGRASRPAAPRWPRAASPRSSTCR